jgi:hypothetical protein
MKQTSAGVIKASRKTHIVYGWDESEPPIIKRDCERGVNLGTIVALSLQVSAVSFGLCCGVIVRW